MCGTGRQPILRNKMENDNYYLLTLAAIAKELKQRGGTTECSVKLAAGEDEEAKNEEEPAEGDDSGDEADEGYPGEYPDEGM